ncbi:pentapeptide repeat-containing protein [Sorangium sp. So ce327]|uniref:pentapeptide repeat-containing protein n=1 Tax=Sorangium sp. So ce327 TaxID=3133301 RepID=UPI003F5E66E3
MATILFLGVEAKDEPGLRLEEEIREISRRLRSGGHGHRIQLAQEWAVRATDLQDCLLRHRPALVHFSGRTDSAGRLVVEDGQGHGAPLDNDAIANLFSILRRHVRCVVLAAGASADVAYLIARHIDCVVGMSAALAREATIAFSGAFYQAIGFGESVQTAFELGCNEIDLRALAHADVPRLILREGVKPEELRLLDPQADAALSPPPAPEPATALHPLPTPPLLRERFFGRTDELDRLGNLLAKLPAGAPTTAAARAPLLGIRGIGGSGKTALAMRFVELHAIAFPGGVFWGDVGTNRDAGERATDMAPREVLRMTLGKWRAELCARSTEESALEPLLGALRGQIAARSATLGRCLLVLDNLDTEEVLSLILDAFPAVPILFTTRSLDIAAREGATFLDLRGLARSASKEQLAFTLGANDPRLAGIDPTLDYIEDHALAIKLLAESMRARPSLTGDEALRVLRSTPRSKSKRAATLRLSHIPTSLKDCFRLSIDRLPRGPLRPFLIAAASQSPISFSLDAARYTSGAPSAERALELAEALCARGLLERVDGDSSQDETPGPRYRMHRLLRDYLREVHGREGFGWIPPTWEIASLAPLLMRTSLSLSAGLANYDFRQEQYFLLLVRNNRYRRAMLRREWDGLAAGIFRRIAARSQESVRGRLSRLSDLLDGADLPGLRLERLMLDEASLNGARLEGADLSGRELRRWPSAREVGATLGAMVLEILGAALLIWLSGATVTYVRGSRGGFVAGDLVTIVLALEAAVALVFPARRLASLAVQGGLRLDVCTVDQRRKAERRGTFYAHAALLLLPLAGPVVASAAFSAFKYGWAAKALAMRGLAVVSLGLCGFAIAGLASFFSTVMAHMQVKSELVGGLYRRVLHGLFVAMLVAMPTCTMLTPGRDSQAIGNAWLSALIVLLVGTPAFLYHASRDPEIPPRLHSVRTTYLRRGDLRGANLRRAALCWVRLNDADLTGADLTGADLFHADLTGAALTSANLTGARLEGARLTNADLRGARLTGADLSQADLEGALLDGAIHGVTTRWPVGYTPPAASRPPDTSVAGYFG